MKNITKEEFNKMLQDNNLVLVDFYADWCGPCRMIAPIIDQIAEEAQDKVKVLKIDVDRNRQLAFTYNIFSIPTLLLFKEGKVVSEILGFRSKQAILELIDKYS